MDGVVDIAEVRTFETRGGNPRYVIRDGDGNEYTTFREGIGDRARELEGGRARIEYHEEQRGQYQNVYLDKVEPAPESGDGDTDPEEAAGRAPAAPARGRGGRSEPHEELPPEELYDKLKPFKERVAEDIKDGEPDP